MQNRSRATLFLRSRMDTKLASSDQENQESPSLSMLTSPLQVRILWTARVSFALGLFFVLFGATAVFFSRTDVRHSNWNWIVTALALWKLAPVLYAVILGSVFYASAGWILGLVACGIALQPVWRRSLALAIWELGFAVCVVLMGFRLLWFSIPCISPDACAQLQ